MRQAQRTGDIGTLLKLLAKTSSLTPADYIKKTVGQILFVYYVYLKYFHQRPSDLEDLVDGLLYISTQQFLEKKQAQDFEAQQKNG